MVVVKTAAESVGSNDGPTDERVEDQLAEAWSQHADANRVLTERQATVNLVGPDHLAQLAFSLRGSVAVVITLRALLMSGDRQQAVEHYDKWLSTRARRSQARSDFVRLAKSVIQPEAMHRRVGRFGRRQGSRLLIVTRRLRTRLPWSSG